MIATAAKTRDERIRFKFIGIVPRLVSFFSAHLSVVSKSSAGTAVGGLRLARCSSAVARVFEEDADPCLRSLKKMGTINGACFPVRLKYSSRKRLNMIRS